MSIYQMSDSALVNLGTRVLDNSESSPIATAMAAYGYDEGRLQQGRALLEAYAADVQARQNEFGEQVTATEALNDAWDAFHSQTYIPHVTIARLVLSPDGAHIQLGIDGRRPVAFDEYVGEARRFYTTIANEPDIQEAMAAYGITAEDVATARADLAELEELKRMQEREKGQAQQATRERNDARRVFLDWLARYQQIAQFAMSDQPDLLEEIGILVRSE
jgi:hypothetical protein